MFSHIEVDPQELISGPHVQLVNSVARINVIFANYMVNLGSIQSSLSHNFFESNSKNKRTKLFFIVNKAYYINYQMEKERKNE